ncbi:murein transglycosylase A [Flavimaricola marinus]|uniref:peptidoglycan lytic exotransglycosylase n=1 Tax=Flavimaricola marinus TaxID=1819565 RepID=A0A238LC98_9RHOB|nr:murein transglycosylase A [Flavimaricola marinus]SMY07202.1 Membrane-bound lytic murein transglycosylase A precursor [Flavimaricola marinus]
MNFGSCAAAVLTGLVWTGNAVAEPKITLLEFEQLSGWAEDDPSEALAAFSVTCGDMRRQDWQSLCAIAKEADDARSFFELFFKPVLIEDDEPALFTGYFEPELPGSRSPDARFRYPLYAVPSDMPEGPWLTRQEIDEGALAGQGLEIAWLEDPVDLFFLQVQGSGRVRLSDGSMLRVGYGGFNGHLYSSIGAELVARGIYEWHQVSADVIRSWVARNPDEGQALLWTNPSYVFFREVSEVPAELGPLGAMNRSITTLRTVAVDPAFVPLGAPVWIEKAGETPMNRLMIAQDTGSAIKGAQRADIFFGTGREAGRQAGRIRDPGRMVVLMPIQRAYAMLPDVLGADGLDGLADG